MSVNGCFVDTSAWFALFVPSDPDHGRVRTALFGTRLKLVTTDYILDETLTLLRARRQAHRAAETWALLHDPRLVTLIHLTSDDLNAAWDTYQRFADKDWSFTDCASKHIIDTYQLPIACSLDGHFRQFGTVAVVPT